MAFFVTRRRCATPGLPRTARLHGEAAGCPGCRFCIWGFWLFHTFPQP